MAQDSDVRVFSARTADGTTVHLRVRQPSRQELDAADIELSAVYNHNILEGLPPRATMIRKLKDRGRWTSDDETRLSSARDRCARLDKLVAKDRFESEEARKAAKKERVEAWQELNGISAEIDALLSHTADAKADEAYRNFLMACTIETVDLDDDGKFKKVTGRLWDSMEAMLEETDQNLAQRCAVEYLTFSAGFPSTWIDEEAAEPNGEGDEAESPTAQVVEEDVQPAEAVTL